MAEVKERLKAPITLIYGGHTTKKDFEGARLFIESAVMRAIRQGRIPILLKESVTPWDDVEELAGQLSISHKHAYNAITNAGAEMLSKLADGEINIEFFKHLPFTKAMAEFLAHRRLPVIPEQMSYKVWLDHYHPNALGKLVTKITKQIKKEAASLGKEKDKEFTEKRARELAWDHALPRNKEFVGHIHNILKLVPNAHLIIVRGALHNKLTGLLREGGFENLTEHKF